MNFHCVASLKLGQKFEIKHIRGPEWMRIGKEKNMDVYGYNGKDCNQKGYFEKTDTYLVLCVDDSKIGELQGDLGVVLVD